MIPFIEQYRPEVVAVVGPTGVGKSDFALRIAHEYKGEIINADALQFYQGMDIGTAKLRVEERLDIPHHLLDIMEVTEEASVQEFQSHARKLIEEILGRGKLPIVVGGSGLYIRAVLDELNFPHTNSEVRAYYEKRIQEDGNEALHSELAEKDPLSAVKIMVNDTRRIVRALEVLDVEGRPFSAFMPERTYVRPALQIGIEQGREVLRKRLAHRVYQMWEVGLLEEVKYLEKQGLRKGKTASAAIGYTQVLQYIDGELSQTQAQELTINATRQYAKRQFTWFKRDDRIQWLQGCHAEF